MNIVKKKEPLILFLGDLFIFYLSIWLALFFRHFTIPSQEYLISHLQPFSILFVFWVLVIYIAGLYERMNSIIRRDLPQMLFKAQMLNVGLAVVFFYFIPYFYITPKTILFIYLITSFSILLFWRLILQPRIYFAEKQKALLIARGDEMKELKDEINSGNYGYHFSDYIDLDNIDLVNIQEDIVAKVFADDIKTVVIDTQDDTVIPLLPNLYNLMFSRVNFVDMHEVYEQLFGKIPLSLVKHGWFLKNVTTETHVVYDGVKRIADILASLFLGCISLLLYPFIILFIKLDDKGKIFFIQERVGQDNKKIRIYKFRTMTDQSGKKEVTKIGKILRSTRLDELPQLLNVLKGELSLIGPRPETTDLVNIYSEQIPYYKIRHLVKPGLSGWAQILHENHPHHAVDISETKNKLSYDLYYVKNRSLFLDLKIGLKTLKTLLSRQGR